MTQPIRTTKTRSTPTEWMEWRLMYVMSGGGWPVGIYGLHPGFLTRRDAEDYKRAKKLKRYRVVRCRVEAPV